LKEGTMTLILGSSFMVRQDLFNELNWIAEPFHLAIQ
jgi:hypothetical protein